MDIFLMIVGLIVAYLIGSFSSAVWIGRIFYKIDVREHGSGNAGATNTIRVLGFKPGLVVLLIDAFKGWLAVFLAFVFFSNSFEGYIEYYKIGLGVFVLLGNIFPLYTGFRGGKGVATLAGVLLALFPYVVPCCLGIFILVLAISRYVSLASIVTAISFPLVYIFVFNGDEPILLIFSILVGLFVPITHRNNIKRLLKGEESKFSFKRKSKE